MLNLFVCAAIFLMAIPVLPGLTSVSVVAQETTLQPNTTNMTDTATNNITGNDDNQEMEPEAGMISRKD